MAERKKTINTGTDKQGAELSTPLSAETEEVVKSIARRKSVPPQSESYLTVEQGDNAKYLHHSLEIAQWEDVDWTSKEAVTERVYKYFKYCEDNDMKPSVTGLGLALNTDRRRLREIAVDAHTQGDKYIVGSVAIKKAYQILENQWADYMQNGKVNPASGIFLGKNYYGYTDEQKITVKPDNPLGEAESAESVRQKYLEEGDTDD